jgi:hypothetical protein
VHSLTPFSLCSHFCGSYDVVECVGVAVLAHRGCTVRGVRLVVCHTGPQHASEGREDSMGQEVVVVGTCTWRGSVRSIFRLGKIAKGDCLCRGCFGTIFPPRL